MTWVKTKDGHLLQGFVGPRPVALIGIDRVSPKRVRVVISCDDPSVLAEVMDKAKTVLEVQHASV